MEMTTGIDSSVLTKVKHAVEKVLKIPSDRIDVEAEFETFGMDSIIAMEMMANLSKVFGILLTPAKFSGLNTLQELSDYIETQVDDEVAPVVAASHSFASTEQPGSKKPTTDVLQDASVRTPKLRKKPTKTIEPIKQLLNEINNRYSIDLTGEGYNCADDVVDAMLDQHLDALFEHYKNKSAVSPEKPKLLQSSVSTMDVAIVGLSCRFPDADNPAQFWENLMAGRCSIKEIPAKRWSAKDVYSATPKPNKSSSKWAALIDDIDCFDKDFFKLTEQEAILIDPQERVLMQEVYRAVQDACINSVQLSGSKTGLFVGYEYTEYEQYIRKLQLEKKLTSLPPLTSASLNFYLANRLSYIFDLIGPSESVNVNCASSAVAINRAYNSLIANECNMAIACGVSLNLFENDYIALSQQGLLSPTGTCAVFDNNADGYTRGEGVGVAILKRLDDAIANGDRIYAVIKSSHQNNRGAAASMSEIKRESISQLLSDCYKKANIDSSSINYIEVNGYASKWGDSFEYEGIKELFKTNASGAEQAGKYCALGSLKGNIGHTEPVNGIAALIKLSMSMYRKTFPKSISKSKINEFIDIDSPRHGLYFAAENINFNQLAQDSTAPIRAGINSFADSGVNVHILLEEYASDHPAPDADKSSPQLCILSARNSERLTDYVRSVCAFLASDAANLPLTSIIYSLQMGRDQMPCRIAMPVTSKKELMEKLQYFINAKDIRNLEANAIYYRDNSSGEKNTFTELISASMSSVQLLHSINTNEWRELALLWVNGVDIDWTPVWQREKTSPVSLPSYPFAKHSYWIDKLTDKFFSQLNASQDAPPKADFATKILSPRNETEQQLQTIWSEVLSLDAAAISVDSSFFTLGGNSSIALKMVSRVNAVFKQSFPLSTLFQAPSIEALADLLDQNENPTGGMITALQTKGEQSPILALPGAGGGIISLQPLSQCLGDKQPFFGVDLTVQIGSPISLDSSVEEMAGRVIAELQNHYLSIPYVLMGYSNGGVIAFEIARRLAEQNTNIKALVLIDTVSPLERNHSAIEELVSITREYMKATYNITIELTAAKLENIKEKDREAYLYSELKKDGFDMEYEQFSSIYKLAVNSDKCVRVYRPQKTNFTFPTYLIRAKNAYPNLSNCYGWQHILGKSMVSMEIDADHFSIIEEKNSIGLANLIKSVIN